MLRSLYPIVLGLGGWFAGLLIVVTTMPTVPLADTVLATVSIGVPIGLGVLPVVAGLARQTATPLSVDTSKAEVARSSLEAGAHIINDVTALAGDPSMVEVARESKAGVILMHLKGTPATMQTGPRYEDVVVEIGRFFEGSLPDLSMSLSQGAADAQAVRRRWRHLK